MNTIRMHTPIVSVDWLAKHLDHPNLIVLDASIKKVTATDYSINHQDMQIKNARFFDIKKSFSNLATPIPNMLASPRVFEQNSQKLGIHSNAKIVVYDTLGIYSSPRAWWMFTAMGYDDVAVLDGGLPSWTAAGYPVEKKGAKAVYEIGNFKTNDRSKCMVTSEDVLNGMNDPNIRILDARSEERYQGSTPEPRDDLKSGHIPNAINLPYTSVLDHGKMRSTEQLIEIFKKLDLQHKKLIFSCGSGITACIILLAAKLSGYDNLCVYDGSWSEWGQLANVPIENVNT